LKIQKMIGYTESKNIDTDLALAAVKNVHMTMLV